MDMMNNSLQGIKRFSMKVGKTLVHFSRRGIRIHPHYRLQLIDDTRMSTVWSIHGRRSRLILLAVILFFIITFVGAALIGVTPLRTILPGYLKRSQRSDVMLMHTRLDSLSSIAAVNNMYLDNMVAILTDDINIDSITAAYNDSLSRLQLPVDSLLTSSDAEREFVRRYEQDERFNVSVLSPVAADGMVFYPPVNAPVRTSAEASGRLSLYLRAESPVSAIYRGTVIDAHYEPGTGHIIVIQHPHDFISVYRGMSNIMVETGSKVNTGSRIGLSTADSEQHPLLFDMWFNGSRINPTPYFNNDFQL